MQESLHFKPQKTPYHLLHKSAIKQKDNYKKND